MLTMGTGREADVPALLLCSMAAACLSMLMLLRRMWHAAVVPTRCCCLVLQGIEVEHKDRLEHLCHRERVEQARMARWGNRERARGMRLPHCEEIYERFGYRYAPGVY